MYIHIQHIQGGPPPTQPIQRTRSYQAYLEVCIQGGPPCRSYPEVCRGGPPRRRGVQGPPCLLRSKEDLPVQSQKSAEKVLLKQQTSQVSSNFTLNYIMNVTIPG